MEDTAHVERSFPGAVDDRCQIGDDVTDLDLPTELWLFLTTGIIGGFTTWSTFSLDAFALWERGAPFAATGYVFASLILSGVAITAAVYAVRQ